jgi:hypothetical protein
MAVRFVTSDQGVLRNRQLRARLLRQHETVRDVLRSYGVQDDVAATGIVGFLCWPVIVTGVDLEQVYRRDDFIDTAMHLADLSRLPATV